MTPRLSHIRKCLAGFWRREEGASTIELALILPLFLLLFLGLVDFGRMAFHYVAAEKAVQVAARIAAVRPAACSGLPTTNTRGAYTDASGPRFGTNCSFANGVCLDPAVAPCTGATAVGVDAQATVNEIWTMLQFAVPNDPTADFDRSNLVFNYEFDPQMNFLGGPYVPMVTVTIEDLPFRFISPLGAIAALAAGASTNDTNALAAITANFKVFSDFSASLPGEDLASGING
ncbi:TadE/TadG family type IV pilus assembly protein [Aestuariivita boseongensis]|uniref:TadE/TadG family type IV pilus assembly protein n=1 Tax=Aestuariivita boseongensis TaxID=1470562 RepID=UPI00068060E4|nr:TadE/TadG family type IV pilus assembly protein [Aestuariivita boseongensis]